jgi:hypothetical protein
MDNRNRNAEIYIIDSNIKNRNSNSLNCVPYFYLNSSIPSYNGKEPLKKTILSTHQKRALYYIHLLESEHPVPILSDSRQIEQREQPQYNSKNIYFHTNYAFYADPICTGKSFVILSLLSLHPCVERKRLLTIWSNGLGMNVFSKIENFEIPLSILVVPASSMGQWNYLLQMETNIKYYILDSEPSIEKMNPSEYEVLLVCDSIFDKVCQHFEGFSVSRIIFDDLLHLEVRQPTPSSFDPTLFGNLRASFTWFVCSEPQLCLQKFKNSRLPFAPLIKQMFSFPYPGLIFRNENECLEQSLSKMVSDINFSHTNVYLENIDYSIPIENEIKDILTSKNHLQIYNHLITFLVFRLYLKFKTIEQYLNSKNLSNEISETIHERYQNHIDPITYDKIKFPVILNCCNQIYDLLSIAKCLIQDLRCPFCREQSLWSDLTALDEHKYNLNKNIFDIINEFNLDKYNLLYLPSLHKDIKVNPISKDKIHRLIREIFKRYKKCLLWNGKSSSKNAFEEFRKQKGILILTKPIQSNLHLSFVDHVYVIHPKEYVCETIDEWYSEYFKKCFDKILFNTEENNISREHFPLTDKELGNFCIGRKNKLQINFYSFL